MANVTTQTGKITASFTGAAQRTLASKLEETVSVKDFGAVGDDPGDGTGTDNTAAYAALVSAVSAGTRVVFPSGIYKGHIVDTKGLKWDFKGSTLVNATNGDPIVKIDTATAVTAHNVTESTLEYKATTFTVTNAASLFSVGDIGTLYDGSTRPSDSAAVNYQTVKIAALSTNTVTIEGHIYTRFYKAQIVFYHKADIIKDAEVENVIVRPTTSHTSQCIIALYTERFMADKVCAIGHTGPGLSIRNSYNFQVGRCGFFDPAATGSGQGYGLQVLHSSEGYIGSILGRGNRHLVDLDSVYRTHLHSAIEEDGVGTAVVGAHNGFSGHLTIDHVRASIVGSASALSFAEEGFGAGATNPVKLYHLLKQTTIGSVHLTTKGHNPNNFGVAAYFQTGMDDVRVGNIHVRHLDATALGDASSYYVVRINGGIALGGGHIEEINFDRAGVGLYRSTDDTHNLAGVLTVEKIVATEKVEQLMWFRGSGNPHLLRGVVHSATNTDAIFEVDSLSTRFPSWARIDELELFGADYQLFDITTDIAFHDFQTSLPRASTIDASAGDGNTTLVTGMEFGRKYHVKVEETVAFNGSTNKDFKLGSSAGDASFLAAVTASGTAVGYAEISGTENVGANIVLSWLNNATPTTGQLTATVKVVG